MLPVIIVSLLVFCLCVVHELLFFYVIIKSFCASQKKAKQPPGVREPQVENHCPKQSTFCLDLNQKKQLFVSFGLSLPYC